MRVVHIAVSEPWNFCNIQGGRTTQREQNRFVVKKISWDSYSWFALVTAGLLEHLRGTVPVRWTVWVIRTVLLISEVQAKWSTASKLGIKLLYNELKPLRGNIKRIFPIQRAQKTLTLISWDCPFNPFRTAKTKFSNFRQNFTSSVPIYMEFKCIWIFAKKNFCFKDMAFYLVFDFFNSAQTYLMYVIFVPLIESILWNSNPFEFFPYHLPFRK